MSRRRKFARTALLEGLEPRRFLSAVFQSAFSFGTASPSGESITGMATDPNGNVYVTGYYQGTMDVDPSGEVQNITNVGNYDIFLMKYSASGGLVWAESFGDTGNDMGGDVLVDPVSGDITVTGSFSGTVDMNPGPGVFNVNSTGGTDALIAQFDTNGNLLWAESFGGSGDDNARKITPDNKGGFLVTGNFQNTADLDPGPGVTSATASTLWDAYISRIDAAGNLTWSDQFTAPLDFYVGNIAADKFGNVYAAGFFRGACDFNPGAGSRILDNGSALLAYVAKYSPAGKLIWVKDFGDGADAAFAYDMSLDTHGNIVVAGSFGGSGDFNPGLGVHTLTEHQSPDAFTGYVMKLTSWGGYLWSGALAGASWSDAFAITTDAGDNIYVAGEINGMTDFDITGSGPNSFDSRGNDDAFLARYDPAGRLVWVDTMGSSGYDHGLHVALGPAGTVYTSGYFSGAAHFGPAGGGANLTAVGAQDSFIAVFSQDTTATFASLAVSPDPPLRGRMVTLTVTVVPTLGVPTGKVNFRDGTRSIATVKLDNTGHAVLRLPALSIGTHSLTVIYLGDENFDPFTATSVLVTVL